MAAYGSPRVVSGRGPEHFGTLELIRQTCRLFNEAHGVAAAHGLRFGIHNHWWEFERVQGRFVYQVMLEHLHPEIFFEVDTYWVQSAGVDPVAVVKELGERAELLHIKDGPALKGVPQVAVGQGVVDVRGIVQASGDAAEWLIVELDDCATDMLEAVELSYHYLFTEGLGHGNKG
jgi:sugar phosphate isomerase/epimerase